MNEIKRIDELDVLKGIGILLMIFDHCFGWGQEVFAHSIIQSFHMPLFFIVSGYLWNSKDNIKDFVQHKIRKILLPHFNFAIIYSLVFVGLYVFGRNTGLETLKSIFAIFVFPTRSDLTMFASPIWFLQALFLVEVVFAILKEKDPKLLGLIISVIAVFGIIYSALFSFMLPFALEPFSTGILFFYLGFMLKNADWIKLRGRKYWLLIPAILIWTGMILLNGCVDMRSARYYNPILYIANGVMGTIIFLNISCLISTGCMRLKNMLRYFSVYSITYLCIHYIFVYYGRIVLCGMSPLSNIVIGSILFVSVILICWLLNKFIMKYIPWIVGRSKGRKRCKIGKADSV